MRRRVGPEEPGDRGVEVGAVGDLAVAVDLLGVRADARGPGGLEQRDEVRARVDVRIAALDADRDLGDEVRVGLEERAEPAVAASSSSTRANAARPSRTGFRPASPP